MTGHNCRMVNETFMYLEYKKSNLLDCDLKFEKIKLEIFPEEIFSLHLKLVGDRCDNCKTSADSYGNPCSCFLSNFELKLAFENALHFMSSEYQYKVLCRLIGPLGELTLFSHSFVRTSRTETFEDCCYFENTISELHPSKVTLEIHRERLSGSTTNKHQPLVDLLSKQFYEHEHSENVSVIVAERRFNVDKKFLALRSPVFKAMFSHNMFEKESRTVNIDDFGPETVETMLLYMYTNDTKNIYKNALEVYKLAHKYEIEDLKNECIEWIKFNVGSENFVPCLQLSVVYGLGNLERGISQFIKSNEAQFVKRKDYQDFLSANISMNTAVLYLKLGNRYRSLIELKMKVLEFVKQNIDEFIELDEFLNLFKAYPALTQEVFVYIHGRKKNEP